MTSSDSNNNGTTNINDLPISNQTDGNIKLVLQEKNIIVDNPIKTSMNEREKESSEINKLITGIQQASASGMTSLPSRDIPKNDQHIVQDNQIQANYVPKGPDDYIKEHQTPEDIIQKNSKKELNNNLLDEYYNDFQLPIMICVLYFLFHLPIVRNNMFKYIPFLFNKDGNLNGTGYIVNSIIFSVLCYGIFKMINYMSI